VECDRTASTFPGANLGLYSITFVNDHDDLPDCANHVKDLFEISFSRADPLRAKVLQLDRRQSTLFRKCFGNERFAGAHRTSKQNAHRHTTRAPFTNALRDDHQVFLHLFHAADDFKSVRRFDKLDEPETLALQNLALPFRD